MQKLRNHGNMYIVVSSRRWLNC